MSANCPAHRSDPLLADPHAQTKPGREVRHRDFGLLTAGLHTCIRIAEDAGGRALPGGIYFLRLEAGVYRGQQKVVVLR